MLTSHPPKPNINNNQKTRKTLLESLEKFREMADSFTTPQCQSNISFQDSLVKLPLPKLIQLPLQKTLLLHQKSQRKANKSSQSKTQRTPTRRRPLPENKLRLLSPSNKLGKPEAIEKSKPLKINTKPWPKTNRMTYVSIEESKPTVVWTTERDTKDGQHLSFKGKPQMRAEKSSSNTLKMLPLLSKLKILKKPPEPPKLPKWMLKTLRTLSMRKPESDLVELPWPEVDQDNDTVEVTTAQSVKKRKPLP